MKEKFLSLRKSTSLALVIVTLAILVFGSMAFFSDRTSSVMNISTASFTKDGYKISREYNDVYYTAGEDIKVTVTEDNGKEDNVKSVVTMSVEWVSPDTSVSPFGNANAADNAVITVGGTAVKYTVNNDGTITFQLPEHQMNASTTGNKREIIFHIPESLKSTGKLNFTFDSVKLSQVTAMGGSGFYAEYDRTDLNAQEKLDFTARVVWDFSKNQDKSVIGYLTGTAGNYGITAEGKGAMYNWSSETSSKQSNYKGSVTSLTLGSGITSIGDHAFDGFNKVDNLTIPETVKTIGDSAFENLSIESLTIPSSVTVLGEMSFGNIEELTEITFNGNPTFPTAGEGSGAFYVDDPYSESNPLRTKVNASDPDVLAYNWTADHRGYTVTVKTAEGGTMTAAPTVAINGKTITLNPVAADQYGYNGATVTYTDESGTKQTITLADDELTFIMPAADVTVTPEWYVIARPMLAKYYSWQGTDESGSITYPIDYNALETVNIVDTYEPDGTETSWDASAYETVNGVEYNGKVTAYLSSDKKTLTLAGNGYGCIFANPDSSDAFSYFDTVTTISGTDIFNTSQMVNAENMFVNNSALTSLDVSNWDVSNLVYATRMFHGCETLTTLDVSKWDTGNLKYAGDYNYMNDDSFVAYCGMFSSCTNLTTLDVSNWDTSNMISMYAMFYGCESLANIDVSGWDTGNVTTLGRTFADTAISSIAVDGAGWDVSKVTTTEDMFMYCENLTGINLSDWNVISLINTSSMFEDSGIQSIDLSAWDESIVTTTYSMFSGCDSLTSVNLVGWNMSNVNENFWMFEGCDSLPELTIPASLTHIGDQFAAYCPKLTEITFLHEADTDIDFPTAGYSDGAFYVYSNNDDENPVVYSTTNPLRTKVTTVNSDVLNYNWGNDYRGFTITVETAEGCSLSANNTVAINGKMITLTPAATKGYSYEGSEVTYTGEDGNKQTITLAADELTFKMPVADVIVTPEFVNIPPMLAPGSSWQDIKNDDGSYTQVIDYETAAQLTTINIVDTYEPDGTETSWDASAYETVDGVDYMGTVTAYLSSDKKTLTLAGNGSGLIYAHPDSYRAFAGFSNVTAITGANILEMNTATDTSSMFSDNYNLATLDVSNWDTRNVTNMAQMFYMCYNLPSLNVAGWDTGNVTNMAYMFNDCETLSVLAGIRNWDTQKVTNMRRMFLGCNSIPSLDLSTKSVTLNGRTYDSWDTGEVKDMSYMFGNSPEAGCALESLNVSTFDMRKVTNMQAMFQGCNSLKALNVTPTQYTLNGDTFHSWDVAKVQKMNLAFKNCSSLTTLDLSGWDTSGVGTVDTATVDDFNEMFSGCSSLSTLNVARKSMTGINGRNYTSWDTSNAVYMSAMFEDCSSLKSLDLKNWNNASATDMSELFSGCSAITQIDLTNFTTGACTYMNMMFYDCSSLNALDLSSFDTSNVKNMSYMFYNCDGLKTLDLAHFVTSSVNRISGMFEDCSNLTTIYATHRFDVSALSYNTDDMFKNTPVLVGGAGTVWDSGIIDKTRALVDGGEENPGYFTNNIFLEYDPAEIEVGATAEPKLTIKSTVFDDYTSILYELVDPDTDGKLISIGPNYGVVTSKAGGTANIKVTLGASNGDTISAIATVEVKKPIVVQAIYSADDNSLTFVYDTLYTAGVDTFTRNGVTKAVTEVYTGFDTREFFSVEYQPWYDNRSNIESVTVADEGIIPVATAYWFYEFTNCTSMDLAKLDVSNVFNATAMFRNCKALTSLDLSDWQVGSLTLTKNMFYNCKALTTVGDLSGWNSAKFKDMSYMFYGCSSLTPLDSISGWQTGNVTDMSSMFNGCSSLTSLDSISGWQTGNVTNMRYMFSGCSSLTSLDSISGWQTGNVTNMRSMFNGCSSLTSLDLSGWQTGNVTDMLSMFNGCSSLTSLDLSGWQTIFVTNMSEMFRGCINLTSLDLSGWRTGLVTSMSYMFYNCKALTTVGDLSGWSTAKVNSMHSMFTNCSNLISLNLSGWSTANLGYGKTSNMFNGCSKLEMITLGANFVWRDNQGYLPAQKDSNIPGADGKWYDIATNIGYTPANVHKDATGIVTYVAVAYDITYDLADGVLPDGVTNPVKYTKYSSDITLNNPTKDGYEFLGWTDGTGSDPQTIVTIAKGSTGDKTFTANWQVPLTITLEVPDKTYSSTFTVNGTVSDPSCEVNVNGTKATVNADGTYSTEITLASPYKLTATATNSAGNSATDSISYTSFTVTKDNRSEIDYIGAEGEQLKIPSTFLGSDGTYYIVYLIDRYAFNGCSALTSVTIPDSVTRIADYAFNGCSALISVTIPNTVTTIESYAFYNCSKLTDVYYSGTEEQWSAITIGSNNTPLTNATIHYESASAAILDMTPHVELPEDVTAGTACVTTEMPYVESLNAAATDNAPDNTVLYGWLIDSGMAQEIVLLEDFEEILHSVYDEAPDWELTLTPLYQEIEQPAAPEETEYTITYEVDGGTLPESGVVNTYTEEDTVTLPVPAKEGYTFDGWYVSSDFTGEAVTQFEGGSENKTFYAKWNIVEEPEPNIEGNEDPTPAVEGSEEEKEEAEDSASSDPATVSEPAAAAAAFVADEDETEEEGSDISPSGEPAEEPETPSEEPEAPAEEPVTSEEQAEEPAEEPEAPAEDSESPAKETEASEDVQVTPEEEPEITE